MLKWRPCGYIYRHSSFTSPARCLMLAPRTFSGHSKGEMTHSLTLARFPPQYALFRPAYLNPGRFTHTSNLSVRCLVAAPPSMPKPVLQGLIMYRSCLPLVSKLRLSQRCDRPELPRYRLHCKSNPSRPVPRSSASTVHPPEE